MRFFSKRKDGGPESRVTGYWLAEIKSLFSVVLLRFDDGSRDAYHSHAFNSLSWLLRGKVHEFHLDGEYMEHKPGLRPIVTKRTTFHKVVSDGTTWVLSFRGPWAKAWQEWSDERGVVTLEHGRKEV